MARTKSQPQRTCLVCRQIKDKRDLVRIVRTPEGELLVDESGKLNGRGAYFCKQVTCWEKGLIPGRLGRALKFTISEDDIAMLHQRLLSQ